MTQPLSEHRLAELRGEYAARFREICRSMTPGDFDELVDEMARVRLKYEDAQAELAKRVVEGRTPPPP